MERAARVTMLCLCALAIGAASSVAAQTASATAPAFAPLNQPG